MSAINHSRSLKSHAATTSYGKVNMMVRTVLPTMTRFPAQLGARPLRGVTGRGNNAFVGAWPLLGTILFAEASYGSQRRQCSCSMMRLGGSDGGQLQSCLAKALLSLIVRLSCGLRLSDGSRLLRGP